MPRSDGHLKRSDFLSIFGLLPSIRILLQLVSQIYFIHHLSYPMQRTHSRATFFVSGLSSPIREYLSNPGLLPAEHLGAVASFSVKNPFDQSVLCQVRTSTREDAHLSIQKASNFSHTLAHGFTAKKRATWLTSWSNLIQDNKEDIARVITLESGKPVKESRAEVEYARSFLDFFAAEAQRETGPGGGFMVPTPFADTDGIPMGNVMAVHEPVGVAALITPWNFPIAMITRKAGPALAAGCPVLLKPSELTPLTAIALHHLAMEAGIPQDAFHLLTTDRENTVDVGRELCTNPLVRKISFTGSTTVGRELMKLSSGTVKRMSLELGGNAPFIVFDDANVKEAASAAVASKYRNAGQTCVCADRFLVQSGIYEEFMSEFKYLVENLSIGNGLEESVDLGPLISEKSCSTIAAKVQEAIQDGAQCVVGGSSLGSMGSQFYAPTILSNVSMSSRIWNQETFGPVACVRKFEDEEEALAIANDGELGLASYFCTTDLRRALRVSASLEAGIVSVNSGIFSTCVAPFGGVKQSGLGREGSSKGIGEYLETKYILMGT